MLTLPSEELISRITTTLNTHRGSVYILGVKQTLNDIPAKKIDEAIEYMREKKMLQITKDSGSSLFLIKTIKKQEDLPELF